MNEEVRKLQKLDRKNDRLIFDLYYFWNFNIDYLGADFLDPGKMNEINSESKRSVDTVEVIKDQHSEPYREMA